MNASVNNRPRCVVICAPHIECPTLLAERLDTYRVQTVKEALNQLRSAPMNGAIWLPETQPEACTEELAELADACPLIIRLPAHDPDLTHHLRQAGATLVVTTTLPDNELADLAHQLVTWRGASCRGFAQPSLDSMPLPLLITRPNGEILNATPKASECLGVAAEKMVGLPLGYDLEPGVVQRIAQTEDKPPLELHVLPGCWQKQAAYMVLIAQSAPQPADSGLDQVYDRVQDMIITTDVNGRITYVNDAFLRHTGYRSHECLGAKPSLVKSGLQEEATYRELWQTISSGQTWSGKLINAKKDGSHYQVEAQVFPIRDQAGTIAAYASVQRDITYQIELEEQLQQAQKMEAIGRLAGGVAHDFNNLLTIILGNSQIAMMKLDNDHPAQAKMEGIRTAADRATNLTRQLLAFSRKQEQEPRLVDANSVIADFQKMIGRLIGEDIVLEVDLHEAPCIVRADPGRLEQVLMNLAVNARDAMPEGGRITLSTTLTMIDPITSPKEFIGAKPGQYVCIGITDTGTGIEPETLNLIFQPFFTTKESDRGTGLGLATVYGIVKEYEGQITVDSTVDEGTTFCVFLPVPESQEDELERTKLEERLAKGQETILLVEDESGVRLMAQEMLELQGYQVICAANAQEALQLYRQHPEIDLLFTDIVMPGMNGIDLAREAGKLRRNLKVLFMSGYPDRHQANQRIVPCPSQYIQKPFTPFDLGQKLRSILDS